MIAGKQNHACQKGNGNKSFHIQFTFANGMPFDYA
jgi:hypothetical protein